MSRTFEIIGVALLALTCMVGVGAFLFRWLKRSQDSPPLLVAKWIVTALTVPLMVVAVPKFGPAGMLLVVIGSGVLAVMWTRSVCNFVAGFVGNMFDGANEELELRPFYSIARSKKKLGKYTGAMAEVRKQLDKFPTDFEGQMLLAEIQTQHLNDLPGAEVTLQRLCRQKGHPPQNIAAALNQLADWQLKFAQDRDAAQRALQQIIDSFPDTELAVRAAQRIAHLAGTEMLTEIHERKKFALAAGVENLGLLESQEHLKPAEIDATKLVAEYVGHLQAHPLDGEVREKLAVLYARHYQRLDLAVEQLEQLIGHPNQPAIQVVRWLNLLADLQIQLANDLPAARQTLQRVIDQYPGTAAAENAQRRLYYLKLGLKANENKPAVQLGSYEQNIGLKGGA